MRLSTLLLVLLFVAVLLLAGCTDKDPEQTHQNPTQSTISQTVPSADTTPDTQGGSDTAEPVSTAPVPTVLETQDDVVIDVTGQPVIGG